MSLNSVDTISTFPGKQWGIWSSPEDVGISYEVYDDTKKLLRRMDTTGFLVIKHGKIACVSGDIQEKSYVYSIRKSINSMLMGKYVEDGIINLDATLKELDFDDIQGLSEVEQQAKIIHLISARSGIYHPASNPGDDTRSAPPRGSVAPGSTFLYNNWDFNVAEAIFEKLTAVSLYEALENNLAIPLEMEDYDARLQHTSGNSNLSKYPAHHMQLSTRDMARLGLLMLNKGNWNGRQLIPQNWVEKMVAVATPFEEMGVRKEINGGLFEFGLMWWVWRDDPARPWLKGAYTAAGSYGQFISVFPAKDVVVAHKTSPVVTKQRSWLQDSEPNVTMAQYMKVLDTLFK